MSAQKKFFRIVVSLATRPWKGSPALTWRKVGIHRICTGYMLHKSCVWWLMASIKGGLFFFTSPCGAHMLPVRGVCTTLYSPFGFGTLVLTYGALLSLDGAACGAVPPFPSHAPHISLLQPSHLLYMTRDTTVTLSKCCSRSPFPPFVPLNITIETEVSCWYYS